MCLESVLAQLLEHNKETGKESFPLQQPNMVSEKIPLLFALFTLFVLTASRGANF